MNKLAILLVLVLVGCNAQGPQLPIIGQLGQAGAPKATIVVGLAAEPDTLFTPLSSVPSAATVRATLSQNFTERDAQNVYQPRLAERTPTLENGGAKLAKTADGRDQLSVTYRIRNGAKFSNGKAVTADDVKFSWELALAKDLPIVSRTVASYYESIATPDSSTVVVVYRAGQLDPLYFSFCCTIVPREVYGAIAPDKLVGSALMRAPVYAGPYTVRDWQAGSSITVEANPDFWLGAPKTKTIVFKFVSDPNALLAQLRSGDIDVVMNESLTLDQLGEMEKLSSDSRLSISYRPAQTWEHLDFNLRDAKDQTKPNSLLGDKRVREAIARGIDRDAIAKHVLRGKGAVVNSFLFGSSWAKAADAEISVYGHDPDAAKRLLEEAGWKVGADGIREKGGHRLELKLGTTAANATRSETVQLITRQLLTIGIKIEAEPVAAATWFATRGTGPLSAGTFDLALYSWVGGDDPQTFVYACSETPTKENGFAGQNYPGYCNREFDAAMAVANTRLLQSERTPDYLKAQKLWTADLPVLPLYQRPNLSVTRKNLRGFSLPPTSTPATFNVWEWELLAG